LEQEFQTLRLQKKYIAGQVLYDYERVYKLKTTLETT
jgi:hypothetical protein